MNFYTCLWTFIVSVDCQNIVWQTPRMKCVLLLAFLVFSSAFCHGHEVQDTKTDVEKINILEDTAVSEDCRRSLKNIGWKNETNDNILGKRSKSVTINGDFLISVLESNVIYDLGHFDECVKFSNRKYCIGKHYENVVQLTF